MATKAFSQFLHDKYDKPARDAVMAYVKMKWGLDCKPNEDQYAVDLVVYRSGVPTGYIEVEVRNWNRCDYQTIHIAHRKAKLLQNNLPTLFFALTSDLTHAYWANASVIQNSPLIEVRNFEVPEGEMFYDCPISEFKYVDLTEPF